MITFTYPQVLELKKLIDENFGVYLHFHDGCGGQYFSFDEIPNEKVFDFLQEYFLKFNCTINISNDKTIFTVEEKNQ